MGRHRHTITKFKQTMSNVVVALGGTVKADKSDEFKAYAKQAIAKTREQAGCEWVKVMVDKENPHAIAIFQSWSDAAAQQSYADAAKAEGKLAEVSCCQLSGSRHFQKTSFYPVYQLK